MIRSSVLRIVASSDDGVLHLFQIVLHHVQPVDAALEILGEAGEQRRDLGVFEVLELGNDVITFLSGLYPFHKIFQTLPAQPEMIDAFGEHSGEEQRVVADVFAHLALAIERRRGTVDRIGFKQHLADIRQRTVGRVVNLEELIGFAELRQQMRNVGDDLRVANANLVRRSVVPPDPETAAATDAIPESFWAP